MTIGKGIAIAGVWIGAGIAGYSGDMAIGGIAFLCAFLITCGLIPD
jgi:hypothetical protein